MNRRKWFGIAAGAIASLAVGHKTTSHTNKQIDVAKMRRYSAELRKYSGMTAHVLVSDVDGNAHCLTFKSGRLSRIERRSPVSGRWADKKFMVCDERLSRAIGDNTLPLRPPHPHPHPGRVL